MGVHKCFRQAIYVCLTLLVSLSAFAQSDLSQISGFVKDATGSTIPNASVTIRNEATGVERRLTTNESGYYVAPTLPPGLYTVTVEATGFKRFSKVQNRLEPALPLSVDVAMDVGAVTETVEVTAQAATVQSETATVGRLVEATQIQNTILNGRNPIWLALMKAGVASGNSMATFNYDMTTPLNINGGRNQDFLITHDGAVAVRTRANGTSIGVADVDAVQEMQILTANYSAEYGRSASGQVRIVTKSGSRDFHGSAYEYLRNEKLDANSWSRNRANQVRPANKFNQFGYSFSGPVFIPGKWNDDRTKLFFLWSQEWVRFRQHSTSIVTVPSLAMRQGNFSELLESNPFFNTPQIVRDPDTGNPFPNNIIPANRLSATGLGLLRAYPEPTPGFLQGRNNFFQSRPQPTNQRKDNISIDFVPVTAHTFRFRHSNYNFTRLDAFRGGFDRAVTDWNRPNKTASINYVWAISPTMMNEALVTASVDRVYIGVQREGERFARSNYGINYPYVFPDRKEIFDKIPTVTMDNFQELDGGPYPAFSAGPIYTFSDNMSKVSGNHTLKWGFYYERSGQNDFDQINVSGVPGGTNNQNGRFIFNNVRAGANTSGLAVANAAMGLFTTYAEIGQRAFTPYRSNMFEWFIQDSWKVTDKLRLELGLRHTYMTPYYFSLWGNIAAFDANRYDPSRAAVIDPATGFILSGDRYNGIVIPGEDWPDAARGRIALADQPEFNRLFSGNDERFFGKRQLWNFAPRLGIAYAINPRNSIRGGFGRFYARPGVSDNIFLGGNPPLQPMVSIANGQANNPSGGRPANFPLFFMTSDPVFKIPAADTWNVQYEREIWWNTLVSVGYVGRTGVHLERERNMNALPVGTLQRPENQGVNPSALRPYKGFQIIALGENAARSEYNAFQLEVNRRFASGFSFGGAYTLSKSEDNASGRRDRIWNPFDDTIYWGPSGFDRRHILVLNGIWELPFLRGRQGVVGTVLGGWQLSGVAQFQTGTPFTVGTNDDFAGIGSVGEFQPWDMRGDPELPRGERAFSQGAADQNFWFRTRTDSTPIFAEPARGTFTQTQTRNTIYNTGFQNWNLGIFKDFRIAESHSIKFRSEFFNFPNHPNWSGVDTNPRSGTFGKVTSKTSERNIQLSLRYEF
jgi:hypothetical protein